MLYFVSRADIMIPRLKISNFFLIHPIQEKIWLNSFFSNQYPNPWNPCAIMAISFFTWKIWIYNLSILRHFYIIKTKLLDVDKLLLAVIYAWNDSIYIKIIFILFKLLQVIITGVLLFNLLQFEVYIWILKYLVTEKFFPWNPILFLYN